MARPSQEHNPVPSGADRAAVMGAAVLAGLVFLLGLTLGGPPLKIAGSVFAFAVIQGLWRGGSELAGWVIGLILATLIAPALGRSCESVIGSLFGTSGLLNRFLSIAIMAFLVVAGFWAGVGVPLKRWLRRNERWANRDRLIGGILGGIEGLVLALVVLWTPLALRPVAEARIDAAAAEAPGGSRPAPPPLLRAIVSMSDDVSASALGGIAKATNPIAGSRLFSLAEDFVMVSRDPGAMAFFLDTPVMQRLDALPSLKSAIERVKADAPLAAVFEQNAVSIGSIRMMLESPTMLEIIDETTVISDLTPYADDIEQAIAEAKARIGSLPPS